MRTACTRRLPNTTRGQQLVTVAPFGGGEPVIYANTLAGHDSLRLIVNGHEEQAIVTCAVRQPRQGRIGRGGAEYEYHARHRGDRRADALMKQHGRGRFPAPDREESMKIIDGGVCAAQGFTAGSIRSGVKDSRAQDDTAIIFSDCECTAAAVYTMNRVKAAPLYVTMEHLENGVARAIVANAGNANACAPDGMENARRMAKAAAKRLGVEEGRRGRRLDRRDRSAPAGRVYRAAPARACAVRRRFGEGQPRHYDDRYQAQDRGGRVHRRRQDLPPGRHLQGQRHDPPQHGHHAVLPDDRLCHHA